MTRRIGWKGVTCLTCGLPVDQKTVSISCGANPGRLYRWIHLEEPEHPHMIVPSVENE